MAAVELLRDVGVVVDWDDFVTTLQDAVRGMLGATEARDPGRSLTPGEAAALRDGGFDLEAGSPRLDDPAVRTAIEYATMVATGLTVTEAGRILQVDDSRVRQRLAAHALYGVKVGHAWRLPRFQFDGRRAVPGIEKVFPRLRQDLHPIAVYTWFTSPDPDLAIDDLPADNSADRPDPSPMSPRDWLRSGGSAEVVAELAGSL
jgi:hypothetical protein